MINNKLSKKSLYFFAYIKMVNKVYPKKNKEKLKKRT